ncbi:MAG: DUF1670 domain-containing protein, partial [Thermoplasmata archaeon]
RGISKAVCVAVNNLPRTLKKMLEKNLIEERLKHVKGVSRRLKTYFLTDQAGKMEVQRLKSFLMELPIMYNDNDGSLREVKMTELQSCFENQLHLFDLYKFLVNIEPAENDFEGDFSTTTAQFNAESTGGNGGAVLENLLGCIIAPQFKRRNGFGENIQIDAKYSGEEDIQITAGINPVLAGANINGHMIYPASKFNGKVLGKTRRIAVKLTITENTDFEIFDKAGIAAMRRNKIQRLTNEAYDQGGLLTQMDLVNLMCCSLRTIKKDIKQLRNDGIFVPTKGQFNGIGTDLYPTKIINRENRVVGPRL